MEPPEVLAIHAVPHPNPKVRRVGFALDDPYVEQVWAGVIGPSALLALRRRPCCGASANHPWLTCASLASPSAWARRSRAAVARGGPSNASSASGWPTGWRATSSGCAPRWRRSAAASSHGCPSGPARSITGCSARTLTGSPSPTPTRPSTPTGSSTRPRHRPPRPPPAPPPRHHPRPRPPTMTLPPVPRRRPDLVPRGPSTVGPDPQSQRAHPCRCPCGAPADRPPSVMRPPSRPLGGAGRGWPRSSMLMSCRWHSDHCRRRCGEIALTAAIQTADRGLGEATRDASAVLKPPRRAEHPPSDGRRRRSQQR
jgi:hypothetical protein